MRVFLILILLVQLAGCAIFENKKQQRLLSGPTKSLIAETKRLQAQSKWAEAEQYLKAALAKQPEHPALLSTYEVLKADWNRHLRYVEDQILVIEARALKNKIPLLEQQAQIDPHNLILKSRQIFWQRLLVSKVSALVSCGEHHIQQQSNLSRQCLQLAHAIKPSPKVGRLLAQFKRKEAAVQTAKRTKKQVRAQQDKAALGKRLIVQGQAALEEGEYLLAIDRLNSASKLQPDNQAAADLLAQAVAARDAKVEELLKIGDEMYRSERIEQAVRAWEAANRMAPGRNNIAQRIDRAGKVLERLEQIRRQKRVN
jgi:tetratricopeptide (TPR) repeat protein